MSLERMERSLFASVENYLEDIARLFEGAGEDDELSGYVVWTTGGCDCVSPQIRCTVSPGCCGIV